MPYKDPEKQKEYNRKYSREWARKNRKRVNKRVLESRNKRVKERKRLVNSIKMASGCVDCGYAEHPEALDFDHVRGKKKNAIGNMVNLTLSWKTIEKEIAKCEIVCANCHRIRTWFRRRYP